jgi:hypothetical protein
MQTTPITIRLGIWVWLIAALLAGHKGFLVGLPLSAFHGVVAALCALAIMTYFRVPTLRTWLDQLDLRSLVLLHVTRFVGIYYLIQHSRGELPREFAMPSGIGEITVATLALLVGFLPLAADRRLRAIRIWNIVGIVDLALVVFTAGKIAMQGDPRMATFTVLPLSLLPTFLVPLLFLTHVVIFLRLRRESPSA